MANLESLHRMSGDHDIVWEFVYAYTQYHHHEHDGAESTTKSREQRTVHIIAPTLTLARAAFDHRYPARCDYEFVSQTPICTIDHALCIEQGRYR